MKRILAVCLFLLLNAALVFAHGNFNETKMLIDSGISCNKLTDAQFEAIGDYYMEQMHPGEAHELMHQMMGGENSETTKQMHIQMAKSIYCGENISMMDMGMMGGGMMNMMGGNMMGGNVGGSIMGYGMMNSGYVWYWNFLNVLYVILLIGLIILVYLWIMKLLKNAEKEKKKK